MDEPTTIIEDLDPEPRATGPGSHPRVFEVVIGVALVLGVVLWAGGQSWQQANREEEKARATATAVIADAEKYYQQGWQYIGEKENNLAAAQFGQVIALRPDYPEGYYSRGWARLYVDNGWSDRTEAEARSAMGDFDKALELRPTYAEAYNGRGLAYAAMRQYGKAIQQFDRAISFRPAFSEAFFNRGIVYRHLNKHREAVADFTSAIKYLVPTIEYRGDEETTRYSIVGTRHLLAAAYSERAEAYQALGEDARALTDYEQAIAIEPGEPWYYEQRARIYESLGDYDSAILQYTRVLEVDQFRPQYYEQRSYLYEAKGDYDSAIRDLDLAQTHLAYGKYVGREELKEDSAWLDAGKGFLYLKKGDYDQAIRQLNLATWHGLKEASVYVGLGRAWTGREEYGLAFGSFDLALQASPNNPDAYAYSALAYAAQGKYALALGRLNKAEGWGESKDVLALLRGKVYLRESNTQAAREEFEKVLTLTKDRWMLSEAEGGLKALEEQK